MKWKLLLGLVILVPVLTFAIQNNHLVDVHFVEWNYQISLAILIYGALLVGIVLGLLLVFSSRVKKKRKQKRLDAAVKKKEAAAAQAASELNKPVDMEVNADIATDPVDKDSVGSAQ